MLPSQAIPSTGFDSFSNKVGNLRGQSKNKFLVEDTVDSLRDHEARLEDKYTPLKKGRDAQGEENIGEQGLNVQIEEEGRILY